VADDQVLLHRLGPKLFASCPPPLCGKLEIRGLGIATIEPAPLRAELKLLADLDGRAVEVRYPQQDDYETILGVRVPRISLDPFEASAPLKIALILGGAFERSSS